MSLEQRHLSPEQIQKAAPGIVKRFLTLGYVAVEQSIDAFREECNLRGHHNASRTKFLTSELVDQRFMVDVAIIPDDLGNVQIEYRYKDASRPPGGAWSKITQTLMDFNILNAIRSMT